MNSLPYRILVADDEFNAADLPAELFRLDGHEVRAVYDGPPAAEAATSLRAHLIVLDIDMPAIAGAPVP